MSGSVCLLGLLISLTARRYPDIPMIRIFQMRNLRLQDTGEARPRSRAWSGADPELAPGVLDFTARLLWAVLGLHPIRR